MWLVSSPYIPLAKASYIATPKSVGEGNKHLQESLMRAGKSQWPVKNWSY